jgi:hypothetical protein
MRSLLLAVSVLLATVVVGVGGAAGQGDCTPGADECGPAPAPAGLKLGKPYPYGNTEGWRQYGVGFVLGCTDTKNNQPIDCKPTVKVTVARDVAKVLRLKSRVIAKGVAKPIYGEPDEDTGRWPSQSSVSKSDKASGLGYEFVVPFHLPWSKFDTVSSVTMTLTGTVTAADGSTKSVHITNKPWVSAKHRSGCTSRVGFDLAFAAHRRPPFCPNTGIAGPDW